MIDWKVIAVFAIFAFLVAFVTGIFSGVAFLDLVLRAFMWGIVFGILGLGILIVINRFLPELMDAFTGGKAEKSTGGGEEVDIVLPDENPHQARVDNDFLDEMNSMDMEEDAADRLNDDEFAAERLNEEISEEGSEEIPIMETRKKRKSPGRSRADDYEALEEINGTNEGANEEINDEINEEINDDSILDNTEPDGLPDLDKFSGSFSGFDDFDATTSGGPVAKSKENVDISGVKQDPAKVAKAIHTWIERDKEG